MEKRHAGAISFFSFSNFPSIFSNAALHSVLIFAIFSIVFIHAADSTTTTTTTTTTPGSSVADIPPYNGTLFLPRSSEGLWNKAVLLAQNVRGSVAAHVTTRVYGENPSKVVMNVTTGNNVSHRHEFFVHDPGHVTIGIYGSETTFNQIPHSREEWFGPCEAEFLRFADSGIEIDSAFLNNDNTPVNISFSFSAEFHDTRTLSGTGMRVPTRENQYFTTHPPASHSYANDPARETWESYKVTVSLQQQSGSTPLNKRFKQLELGCPGGTGSDAHRVVSFQNNTGNSFSITFELKGRAGPAYMKLVAMRNNSLHDNNGLTFADYPMDYEFELTVTASSNDGGDGGLETWQIALIAVSCVALVTFVVLIPTAWYLRIRERKRRMVMPAGPLPVNSGGEIYGIRGMPGGEAVETEDEEGGLLNSNNNNNDNHGNHHRHH